MLQKTYSIYSDDLNDVQLFIETGKNHIACWCKKNGESNLQAFEFFQCDDYTSENFEELIENTKLYSRLLTMPVSNTFFLWNTNEVLCLPNEKNDPDFLKQNFDLLAGNAPHAAIFSKPTDQCLVAWRIDDEQQHIAEHRFNGASFAHQYNVLLPALERADEDAVYLFFYPHYFTLASYRQKKLQYIQTTKYATPEDVLYFVLNVCTQYEIKDVPVFCGGFIEERSSLFITLYQYLEGFQFIKADDERFAAETFKEYAPHYFAPYVNYAV